MKVCKNCNIKENIELSNNQTNIYTCDTCVEVCIKIIEYIKLTNNNTLER